VTKQEGFTQAEHTVLSLLCDHGETRGLQLVKWSNGELARASIYVLLSRLERRGFVASRYIDAPSSGQGPRRRLYSLTNNGKRALCARESDPKSDIQRKLTAIFDVLEDAPVSDRDAEDAVRELGIDVVAWAAEVRKKVAKALAGDK